MVQFKDLYCQENTIKNRKQIKIVHQYKSFTCG